MFEIYREKGEKRDWRWRLMATNGKIIADSGEGYVKRSACLKAIERVRAIVPTAKVTEQIL